MESFCFSDVLLSNELKRNFKANLSEIFFNMDGHQIYIFYYSLSITKLRILTRFSEELSIFGTPTSRQNCLKLKNKLAK
jgi:hypothetical protein